jgi:hypothetical protein
MLSACQFAVGYDADRFLSDLQKAGIVFDYTAMLAPNIWLGAGQTILVKDERVHLYEFPDSKTAHGKAAQISADGASIVFPYQDQDGSTQLMLSETLVWQGAPHLFRRGRLIVVYVGANPELVETLSGILGEFFAGESYP